MGGYKTSDSILIALVLFEFITTTSGSAEWGSGDSDALVPQLQSELNY